MLSLRVAPSVKDKRSLKNGATRRLVSASLSWQRKKNVFMHLIHQNKIL